MPSFLEPIPSARGTGQCCMFSMLGRRLVFGMVFETVQEEWVQILSARESKMTEKPWTPLLRGDSAAAAVWDVAKAPAEVLSCLLLAAALP